MAGLTIQKSAEIRPPAIGISLGDVSALIRCLIITSVVFLVVASAMPARISVYDEGLILVGASRVLDGDVPYRDFWTMYGPGQFYVIAGLMALFGKAVMVERLYDCAVRTAIVCLAYRIVRRSSGSTAGLLAGSGLLVLVASTGTYSFPIYPALACSLAAILFVVRSFEAPARARDPLAAGLCAGLAALFRHDLGLYTLVACASGLLAHDAGAKGSRGAIVRSAARSVALAVAGCASVAVPAMAAMLAAVPVHDLYQNLIDIPLNVYPKVRALPFPRHLIVPGEGARDVLRHLRDMSVYVPCLSVAAAACAAVGRRLAGHRPRSPADRRGGATAAMLAVATVLFTFKGLVRVSPEHMLPAIACAVPLLAVSAGDLSRAPLLARLPLLAACGGVAISLATFALQTVRDIVDNAPSAARIRSCEAPQMPGVACFTLDPALIEAAAFVEAHTAPEDRIYVGPGRHDKIFFNDVTLYFAAQRLPGTKWHDAHPGVQTTRTVQAAMISDLEAHHVRIVAEDTAYDAFDEPNDSRLSSGVTLFDDYVARNFTPVFRAGSFTVLERKPS